MTELMSVINPDWFGKGLKWSKPKNLHKFRVPRIGTTGFDGLGFKIRYDEGKDGHYIDQVYEDGPAKQALLKVGDRIIQLNGHTTEGLEIYKNLNPFC